jgi:hypothetical protein
MYTKEERLYMDMIQTQLANTGWLYAFIYN